MLTPQTLNHIEWSVHVIEIFQHYRYVPCLLVIKEVPLYFVIINSWVIILRFNLVRYACSVFLLFDLGNFAEFSTFAIIGRALREDRAGRLLIEFLFVI